ncbi:MAG: hypothetical protein ACRDYC_01750, partial [Acidimicrobiales bacterium]
MSYKHLQTVVHEEGTTTIMGTDTARSLPSRRLRSRPGLGARVLLVGLLAPIGLLAAACGGGTKNPAAASTAATSTTVAPASSGSTLPGESSQTEQLQFAQCMRANGVSNYPDPTAGGGTLGGLSAAGINPASPAFQSALQACKAYNPSANLTPAQSAAQNAEGVEVSQ